ncbi:MAG: DNA alkylation repair protein [Fuerstia sp.]|nr:DNA alkylation repair protein [Fuerstiella sp.]
MTAVVAQMKLQSLASATVAASSVRFFKTGPGQYGEGDLFIGVRVPVLRKMAREFRDLPLQEVDVLLCSAIHEERLLAILILTQSLARCDAEHRKRVYDFYMSRIEHVNNWDLVDTSAPAIVGGHLRDKSRKPLMRLAKSTSLWKRRIAIVATQHFIRLGEFDDTLSISRVLLLDNEDLIHKAVGWMLREVGERDAAPLVRFLDEHASVMPRTMLRYAIEHFSSPQRKAWLAMKQSHD